MLKNLTTFLLFLGLFIGEIYPSSAQLFARVQTAKPQNSSASKSSSKQLKMVLNDLRTYYKKDILFLDKNIEAYQINDENVNYSLDLEQNLNIILKKTDLSFKKSKNGNYVIIKKNLKENVSINQPIDNAKKEVLAESITEKSVFEEAKLEEPIKGKVVDEKGSTLQGVSVVLKGSKKGTVTDANGSFQLEAPKNSTLIFSFIGYKTQEIQVGDDNNLTVKLFDSVSELSEVAVVGSRSNVPRTKTDTPAPVDVISVKELSQTGQTDLTQMINFSAPSFNSARQTISNGTDHIDPATLRGLGPDQVLVLVNGKRQHSTALVNVNSTVGRGSVGTDLNAIPVGAIERIEVLRDGAAAQYGSDAIAGVINVVLRKSVGVLSFNNQYGQTKMGDGGAYIGNLNYGIGLGNKGGYLNATLNYSQREPTNRTGSYNNNVYLANLPATRFEGTSFYVPLTAAELTRQQQDIAQVTQKGFNRDGMIVGNAKTQNIAGFVNLSVPIAHNWELYSFGGFNQRYGKAAGFYRYPNNTRASVLSIFPDGYLPFIETNIKDFSGAVGFKKTVADGWNIDFSNVYGGNSIDFSVANSLNASLGANSPKNFYCGQLKFTQNTTKFRILKRHQRFWIH
jgi:iron complex outermembrane recepter protein